VLSLQYIALRKKMRQDILKTLDYIDWSRECTEKQKQEENDVGQF